MKQTRFYGLVEAEPILHNGGTATRLSTFAKYLYAMGPWSGGLAHIAAVTPPECWANALSFPVNTARLRQVSNDDGLIVQCRVQVQEGRLGIGMTAEDGSTFVSNERIVAAEPAAKTVGIWIRRPEQARQLLFRNVDPGGRATRFKVFFVSALVRPGARNFTTTWSDRSVKAIDPGELGHLLEWAQCTWDMPFRRRPVRRRKSVPIEIVEVEELPALLGMHGTEPTPQAKDKPLADWKMETDDAPILECLWRARAPRRHLEFGTWEGFGATLVARNTDAQIWTINLPEGELTTDGTPLYAATDAGESIGRMYREAGVAARVHQMLCDSRNFDTDAFATNFFDTVLVDGGHTPDIVVNDTEKALRVLRPGGLLVWHDFCPDPEALARNLAPLGVVQAVAENLDRWRPLFDRLYWIRKSWLLVGERNDARAA